MHSRFLPVFSWMIAHFFVAMNMEYVMYILIIIKISKYIALENNELFITDSDQAEAGYIEIETDLDTEIKIDFFFFFLSPVLQLQRLEVQSWLSHLLAM